MKRLLVIDDERGLRVMIRAVMEARGWEVIDASSGEDGLAILERDDADVVLTDMRMPGIDGNQVLSAVRAIDPDLPVVMLTAFGAVDEAVEAMKLGAFDYLTKPADNEELAATLEKAREYGELSREGGPGRSPESSEMGMVGEGPAMRRVFEFIERAGPSEATILVRGESGTGKELAAEALHRASERAGEPFIKVNCAALPDNLLESELFGYVKGAFTGAVKDKPGRFQLAHGGTLFLDEVGEMPMALQPKLLRALQEKVVEPLGSVRSVKVDARIIAATNRDLKRMVEAGEFREDLYYRLNVLELALPPLRERPEDLAPLAGHLLDKLRRKNRKQARGVSPAMLDALAEYEWPGNVRELENVLERALILGRGETLGPESLPPYIARPSSPDRQSLNRQSSASQSQDAQAFGRGGLGGESDSASSASGNAVEAGGGAVGADFLDPLEEAEREALARALESNDGHRGRTAEALGISRRTLQYKLRKYGMTRK